MYKYLYMLVHNAGKPLARLAYRQTGAITTVQPQVGLYCTTYVQEFDLYVCTSAAGVQEHKKKNLYQNTEFGGKHIGFLKPFNNMQNTHICCQECVKVPQVLENL